MSTKQASRKSRVAAARAAQDQYFADPASDAKAAAYVQAATAAGWAIAMEDYAAAGRYLAGPAHRPSPRRSGSTRTSSARKRAAAKPAAKPAAAKPARRSGTSPRKPARKSARELRRERARAARNQYDASPTNPKKAAAYVNAAAAAGWAVPMEAYRLAARKRPSARK